MEELKKCDGKIFSNIEIEEFLESPGIIDWERCGKSGINSDLYLYSCTLEDGSIIEVYNNCK